MADDPTIQNPKSEISDLKFEIRDILNRPPDQRLREYKYRFAQAVVFGLPVVGLQYFGLGLGGAEAAVWVGLLQAALAGWVLYVGAAGMILEGFLRIRSGVSAYLVAAMAYTGFYLASFLGLVVLIVRRLPERQTFWFHWAVLILIIWCGIQWSRLGIKAARASSSGCQGDL